MRFSGKVAIVTGGAGGVGKALVRKLTGEGAAVMVADVSAEGCQSLTKDIEAAGGAMKFIVGDLREKTYCERVVAETVEHFGGVDVLVNNAGIIPRGTILETSDDMWHTALDVNLTAMFYLCRAAIPPMKARGGGAIVNTSSVWGVYPGPQHVAYCTSKGAVASFTKSLGRDHAPDGIRVNAVCPHEINTPMLRSGFERRGLDPDQAVAELNKTVPLGHIAEPEEIADVIAFLASSESRYIAGETVEVTGAKPVAN
ncbi:SDR family NAD(P)-dependent oxidoreductase [Streptomyces botrytidirepellens]|uniref:SDR family oxidoreductase n=1 Tax=Streptomyces botrytidirepellens TaxID=2486417 RepID=A0A3M8XBL0_9ACTN|nr:SDR family NAD(P)-dependent oxidoreductase [Streptomyces botrytidirepellens]RNG38341.1 SDR family oxidoreductase [Streptomyces botrytidirepellens]